MDRIQALIEYLTTKVEQEQVRVLAYERKQKKRRASK